MRSATLKELGFNRTYWAMVAFFAAISLSSAFGWSHAKSEQTFFGGVAAFFLTISALAAIWPVWRVHERQGVRFARVYSIKQHVDGILIPVSRAKRIILLVGAVTLATGSGFMLSNTTDADRGKMGLAVVFYTGFAVVWAYVAFRRTYGIILTTEGVVWHKILQPPAFLPWDAVAKASPFLKREKYTTALCLGIAVTNVELIETSAKNRSEREGALKTSGWHVEEDAEMLLAPVGIIATAIEFYKANPHLRHELNTGSAVNRFESFAEATVLGLKLGEELAAERSV